MFKINELVIIIDKIIYEKVNDICFLIWFFDMVVKWGCDIFNIVNGIRIIRFIYKNVI